MIIFDKKVNKVLHHETVNEVDEETNKNNSLHYCQWITQNHTKMIMLRI